MKISLYGYRLKDGTTKLIKKEESEQECIQRIRQEGYEGKLCPQYERV